MSPSEINTARDILTIRETVWNGRSHWMHVTHNGAVAICEQRAGKEETAMVSIPRRTFQAMMDWYLKDQESKP